MYRNLKLDEGLRWVPVIVVSSIDRKAFAVYRKSHNLWKIRRAHREGVLEKPLEADDLIQTVGELTQPGAVSQNNLRQRRARVPVD